MRYRCLKLSVIIYFFIFGANCFAQNGYIKFNRDSILRGYIRIVTLKVNQETVLEYWETKSDKNPIHIRKKDIEEYAIKKDTFIIIPKEKERMLEVMNDFFPPRRNW
jgi:hypothetical protein